MANIINDSIQQSTLVRAEPRRVYDAIATSKGLNGWFTVGGEVDVTPGGKIFFRWKDWGADGFNGTSTGEVLEAVPGKRFVFQWAADQSDYKTTIEMDFEPHSEGTVIRLQEHGYHNTTSGLRAMLDCACGWGEALTLLKFYVEHGLRY